MNFLSALKTLLRTPFKTIITFALLAAVSFGLFSRAGEYAVTSRELNRLAARHRGIGAAELKPAPLGLSYRFDEALMTDYKRIPDSLKTLPVTTWNHSISAEDAESNYRKFLEKYLYQPLTNDDIKMLSSLPHVSRTSTRYMTAGVSEDGYLRSESIDNFYKYATHTFVIEGTYSGRDGDWGFFNSDVERRHANIKDVKILAGYPELKMHDSLFPFNLTLYAFSDRSKRNPYWHFPLSGFNDRSMNLLPELTLEDIRILQRGKRYIFTATHDPDIFLTRPVNPGSRIAQIQWPTVYPLEGQPDNYLELEEFAALKSYIDLVEADRHTFDMVYTDDMSVILRFALNDIVLINGRMLTPADTREKAHVCVVHRSFLRRNNLQLGDKITMRLGDRLFMQHAAIGAVAAIPERLPENEVTVELEIVGIYEDMELSRRRNDNPYWVYTPDTIFVPLSLLPETADTENHDILPSEFCFVIDNARNISAFLKKAEPLLEEAGMTLFFTDEGWLAFEEQFGITDKLSIIAVASLAFAAAVAILFTTYLFIGRKKKDYTVMRALGTNKLKAAGSMLTPLFLVAFIAVISGSVVGLFYTEDLIRNSLVILLRSNPNLDTSVPLGAILGCILGQLAFLCGFAVLSLWQIGKKSPLTLLQSSEINVRKARKAKDKFKTAAHVSEPALQSGSAMTSLPAFKTLPRKFGAFRFLLHYLLLKNRRTPARTLLTVLLAAVFFGAIGQFAVMRHSYRQLYNTIEIEASFTAGLSLWRSLEIIEFDYIKDSYFERIESNAEVNGAPADIIITNNVSRFADNTVDVEFAPGFDNSFMLGEDAYCILGGALMDSLGLEFGDEVLVVFSDIRKNILNLYPNALPELVKEMVERRSTRYIVAGRVDCDRDIYNNNIYVPVNYVLNPMVRSLFGGRDIFLDTAKFTLSDNTKAAEFRAFGQKITRTFAGRSTFEMDTRKLESTLAGMRLFNALFPVVTVTLILIGGLLPGLMIIQSSKEAALLRILGTTKSRARTVFVLNQLVLSFIGISTGLFAVWLFNPAETFEVISGTFILCGGLYFAACLLTTGFAAFNITMRKVLELLQIKE